MQDLSTKNGRTLTYNTRPAHNTRQIQHFGARYDSLAYDARRRARSEAGAPRSGEIVFVLPGPLQPFSCVRFRNLNRESGQI